MTAEHILKIITYLLVGYTASLVCVEIGFGLAWLVHKYKVHKQK